MENIIGIKRRKNKYRKPMNSIAPFFLSMLILEKVLN
jgi:hypothetical protein